MDMVEQERMGTLSEREDSMWNSEPGNACRETERGGESQECERECGHTHRGVKPRPLTIQA